MYSMHIYMYIYSHTNMYTQKYPNEYIVCIHMYTHYILYIIYIPLGVFWCISTYIFCVYSTHKNTQTNSYKAIYRSSTTKCIRAQEMPWSQGEIPKVLITTGFNRCWHDNAVTNRC